VTERKTFLILAVVLTAYVVFSPLLSQASAQTEESKLELMNHFSIPAFNSTIEFSATLSYANASLQDNTWHFTDLVLNGLTNSTLNQFSVSARNCNVTIASFLSRLHMDVGAGADSVLNYSVSGLGTQTFNYTSGHYSTSNTYFEVIIDGVAKDEGDGWVVKNGGVSVSTATSFASIRTWFPINPGPSASSTEPVTLALIVTPLVIALIVLIAVLWRRASTRA
jgi:hypothetical protein